MGKSTRPGAPPPYDKSTRPDAPPPYDNDDVDKKAAVDIERATDSTESSRPSAQDTAFTELKLEDPFEYIARERAEYERPQKHKIHPLERNYELTLQREKEEYERKILQRQYEETLTEEEKKQLERQRRKEEAKLVAKEKKEEKAAEKSAKRLDKEIEREKRYRAGKWF
ncbi:MAG: hypothetical protein Q9220_001789 [cf. Caloplaca sp. 1 TL-2023]